MWRAQRPTDDPGPERGRPRQGAGASATPSRYGRTPGSALVTTATVDGLGIQPPPADGAFRVPGSGSFPADGPVSGFPRRGRALPVRGAPPLREELVRGTCQWNVSVPAGGTRQKRGDPSPRHSQRIAHRGPCGKTPVVAQNRRPRPQPAEMGGTTCLCCRRTGDAVASNQWWDRPCRRERSARGCGGARRPAGWRGRPVRCNGTPLPRRRRGDRAVRVGSPGG